MIRIEANHWKSRMILGLALTILVCASLVSWLTIPFVDSLDRQTYDSRVRAQQPAPSSAVVIVDIDERALAEVGRWPWSRGTLAQMTTALTTRGLARTIAYDVLFAETQNEPGEDLALAQAISAAPVVLGYYLSNDLEGRTSGQLPLPAFSANLITALGRPVYTWSGFGANLAMFQAQAQGGGFFSPVLDADGVVRRLPLFGKFGNEYYESFSVAVLRHYLGGASVALGPETLELIGQRGRVQIPVSGGTSALVPFAGAAMTQPDAPFSGRFVRVSAADVVSGKADWSLFKDRIVLVGTSAPGLSDLRATPISRTTAGVEIHATLIAGAIEAARGDPLRHLKVWPDESVLISAAATALIGALLAILMPSLGAVGVLLLAAATAGGLSALSSFVFSHFGLFVPGAACLLLVAILAGMNLAWGYFVEGRARRAVAELFGEYVSPAVVAQMTRHPERFGRMESENRELTILFADIRGFTRISESMEPEQLREFINEFLTAMTECIHRYNGTVDKYIGDAVMAFWGAPMSDSQHADHAVAAALAMTAEVERLNIAGRRRGWPALSVGIGINTGVARVGDMGSKLRRAYTVLGDSVNLASRLEALTKQFNTPIIVGETTARQAGGHPFVELAQVTVAGRTESTRIFVPTMLATTRPFPAQEQTQVSQPASASARVAARATETAGRAKTADLAARESAVSR